MFLGRDKVAVPDMQKLYMLMKKKGKVNMFEEFMLTDGRHDLTAWLRSQQIVSSELKSTIKYELDCGDAVIEKGRTIQMLECVKNPYGQPYIPGSSLKGMFRTILLCQDIIDNPDKYTRDKTDLEREITKDEDIKRINKNTFLKRNIGNIEAIKYRTLKRNEEKPSDVVNDIMQGFIVSDSEPLSVDDLVLCQKVERHVDGIEKTLPILRECIKPNVEIRFTITIDTSVCKINSNVVVDAIKKVIENYYIGFQKKFNGIPAPKTNYLYLGGGSGFVSKTVLNSLYKDDKDKIRLTQKVLEKTKVPRNHKHYKDNEYGVSPHIIKCTRYQGQTLQMGLCKLEKMKQTVVD
jgi:CRISPR/Cas system CSM-associated protein Csm5 (group 7 of RAMP superfamily)